MHQCFISESVNEYSEAIYSFPISEGICLEQFEAKYDKNIIRGIVRTIDEAKKEYQKNKSKGNLVCYAQMLKKNDQDYCEIQLGNIPPNKQVEITLRFSQQLYTIFNKYLVATIPLQFYQDHSQLQKNILTLDLFCTGTITYAESKGYNVEKAMLDDKSARFNLTLSTLKKGKDFQLIFQFEGMFEPQVILGSSEIFHEDSVKKALFPISHSAMISFVPNFNEDFTEEINDSIIAAIKNEEDIFFDEFQQKLNQEYIDHLNSSRSEFIFLLDRSGSMKDQPINNAIQALILFLKSLPKDSYFNVISFGSNFQYLFPSSTKYNSESLEEAINIIKNYTADLGGTEIFNPLNSLFKQNRIHGYNKQIFILTDGKVNSTQQVVSLIKQNNKFNRVFSIGFGSKADKQLIERIAVAGKGISQIVSLKADLSEIVINMLSMCITPTFDNFKITYDNTAFDQIFPKINDFPCVFKDEIMNIHLFLKHSLDFSRLTDEQKKIQIEYFDSHKNMLIQKNIKLEMQDNFSCNQQLQQSVFKIGKQMFLNENLSQENTDLIQEAIYYQLLTKKTALVCVFETLNDEQRVIFQNLNIKQSKKDFNLNKNQQIKDYNLNQIEDIYQKKLQQEKQQIQKKQGKYESSKIQEQNRKRLQLLQALNVQKQFEVEESTYNKFDDDLKRQRLEREQQVKEMEMIKKCYSKQKSENQQQAQKKYQDLLSQCAEKDYDVFVQQFRQNQINKQRRQKELNNDEKMSLETQKPVLGVNKQTKTEEQMQKEIKKQKQLKNSEQIGFSTQQDCLEVEEKQKIVSKYKQDSQLQIQKQTNKDKKINNKLGLDEILNLVDSDGIWKYDETIILMFLQADKADIDILCQYFVSCNGFMTLFMIIILETYFKDHKPKWTLISKKSINYIKTSIKNGANFNSIKQNIQSLILN